MPIKSDTFLRASAWFSIVIASVLSSGCAAIFRGTSETVTVVTQPAGESVFYAARRVSDGEAIVVRKRFDEPRLYVGDPHAPYPIPMTFQPDPWLIGDAAWLLLGVVPGLVALGVDFGTGAWRDIDSRQVVVAPRTAHAEAAKAPDPGSAPEPFAHPIQP